MLRKLGVAGVVAVVLSLVVAGLALALSITVNGTVSPADEWGTSNQETCTIGQPGCSRAIDDGRDVLAPQVDWYDIENVHVTNDSNNLYLRMDFYGDNYAAGAANTPGISNTWKLTTAGRPLMTICLDIDASGSSSSNGATGSDLPPGYCNGGEQMFGVDYVVQILARSTGVPFAPRIFAWDGVGPWSDILADALNSTPGTIGYLWSANALTEVGLPWSQLGYTGNNLCPLSGTAQPCSYRMSMFYDNGVDASDDSIPNSGMATNLFGCDTFGGSCSPTAITLDSLQAQPTTSPVLPVALIGLSAIALIGSVLFFRRRKQTT
jgi:hypothetical protein